MIKAISNNVIIDRDEDIKSMGCIDVSDGASIKALTGTVVSTDSNLVKVGDRVRIPHYGVTDTVIDGHEYAIVKASKLFAKIDSNATVPINHNVLIRKCVNDHVRDESGEIALFMTDKHIEMTYWCEIIDVASDCSTITGQYKAHFCVAPEDSENLAKIGHTSDFCLREEEIKFVTKG